MASENNFKGFVLCPNCRFVVTRFGDVPIRHCDKCKTAFHDNSNSENSIEDIFSQPSSDNNKSSSHDNSNRAPLSLHGNGSDPLPTRTSEPLDVGNDGVESESSNGRSPRNGGKKIPIYKRITKSQDAKDDKNVSNWTNDFIGSPFQQKSFTRSSRIRMEVPASPCTTETLDGLHDKRDCSSTGDHIGSPSRESSLGRTFLGGSEHSAATSRINKASDVKDHANSSNQASDFMGSPSIGSSCSRRTRRPSAILDKGVEKSDTCSVYSEMSSSSKEQLQESDLSSGSSSRNSRMFTLEHEIPNDDFLSKRYSIWSETDTSFTGESSRISSKYIPSVTTSNHEATPKKDAFYSEFTIPQYPTDLPRRSRRTLVKDAQLLKPYLPTETVSCCLHCEAEGYRSSVEYSAPNPLCAHIHHREGKVELQQKQESSERCYRPVLGGINFLFCYKCLKVFQMPLHFKFSRKKINMFRCGGCEDIISYSVIDGIHIVPRGYSPGETYSTGKDARKKPQGILHRLMGYFSARDMVCDETGDVDDLH